MKTKKCIICGKEFQPRDRRRKTCSDECFRQSCVLGRKKRRSDKGKKIPESQKEKISNSVKKAFSTPEMRKKLSENRKGKKISDSHKKNISSGVKEALNTPKMKEKLSEIHKGHEVTEETRKKMSEKAKNPERLPQQQECAKKGTAAAQKSPLSGRFETNINAKEWVIMDPTGKTYKFTNLRNWIRKNIELFTDVEDAADDPKIVDRIHHGLGTAKRNTIAGKSGTTWYGWSVIGWGDNLTNLQKQQKKAKTTKKE